MLLMPPEFWVFVFGTPVVLLATAATLYRPALGLSLMLAWPLFFRLISDNQVVLSVGFVALGALTALAVIVQTVCGRPRDLGRSAVHALMIALFLLAVAFLVVGLLRGNDPLLAVGDFFHFAIEIVFFFLLAYAVLGSRAEIQLFIRLFLAITLLLGVVILLLYASNAIVGTPAGSLRADGLFQLQLGPSFPLAHFLFFIVLLVCEHGKLRSLLLLACTLLLLFALALTFKRTFWIASVLSLACVYWLARRRRAKTRFTARLNLVLPAVLLICVAVAGGVAADRYAQARLGLNIVDTLSVRFMALFGDHSVAVQGRWQQYQDALDLMARNPLGYGLGSEFNIYNPGRVVLELSQGKYTKVVADRVHYVHNVFLHYGLQLGVLGALVYYAAVGWFLWSVQRSLRVAELGLDRSVLLGSFAAVLGLILAGATTVASNTHYISLFMALAMRLGTLAQRDHRQISAVRE